MQNARDQALDDASDRVMVFIDGNNLYHGLKSCGWPTWISLGKFAQRSAGGRRLVGAHYYNALPPVGSPKERAGHAFLAQLTGAPDLRFHGSRLQAVQKYGAEGPYQSHVEKGADTALTADLVTYAFRNEFDVAIIVSSDGDFEPPARQVRELHKRVEVMYFKGRRPFVMEEIALMREIRRSLFVEMDKRRPSRKPRPRRPQP